MSILYLHGFASGPRSRKALFFAERLRERGFSLEIPDLAQGDFEHLTITRQLAFIEQKLDNKGAVLIGSSLGGYLAALYAERHPEINRLVLMAPAFGFYELWSAALGPERLAQWRESGFINVFHYAEGREVPLDYGFLEDAAQYDPFPHVSQPVLIFHGERDAVVPIAQSLAFVAAHPQGSQAAKRGLVNSDQNSPSPADETAPYQRGEENEFSVAGQFPRRLVRFKQSEHELTDVLESIWHDAEQFLLTDGSPVPPC